MDWPIFTTKKLAEMNVKTPSIATDGKETEPTCDCTYIVLGNGAIPALRRAKVNEIFTPAAISLAIYRVNPLFAKFQFAWLKRSLQSTPGQLTAEKKSIGQVGSDDVEHKHEESDIGMKATPLGEYDKFTGDIPANE